MLIFKVRWPSSQFAYRFFLNSIWLVTGSKLISIARQSLPFPLSFKNVYHDDCNNDNQLKSCLSHIIIIIIIVVITQCAVVMVEVKVVALVIISIFTKLMAQMPILTFYLHSNFYYCWEKNLSQPKGRPTVGENILRQ